jgi:glycosyltransferase involved in cell wall biosynthesis
MAERTVYINGKFLSQKLSGVQRYAAEICKELTSPVKIACAPDHFNKTTYQLPQELDLLGTSAGIIWEQHKLPRYLNSKDKPLLLSLCNVAPLLYENKITCLHDIAFERHPQFFSKKFVLYYRWLIPRLLKSSRHIITVSEFSKREISSFYDIDPGNISVVPNASSFVPIQGSEQSNVHPRPYFLFVGSLDPRKNLLFLLQAFHEANLEDTDLIIVGAGHASFAVNPEIKRFRNIENIVFTGYISDAELRNYYAGAIALINPSLYEGFGLPIAEALSMNTPVLASAIEAFEEVGGTDVVYFCPTKRDDLSNLIKTFSAAAPLRSAAKGNQITWKTSAAVIDNIIHRFNDT